MSAPDRTAWIAAVRRVLDLIEPDPEIPLPAVGWHSGVEWSLYGTPCAPLAARIEAALPCPLGEVSVEEDNPARCTLSGLIDGIRVSIGGWTAELAERRVTGTRTVEDVNWVRKTDGPESGEQA